MMRNIGSYFKVVDADKHRIIEELRNLREKKRKDVDDIFAADAAKAKSIRIREGYVRANLLTLMRWKRIIFQVWQNWFISTKFFQI